MNELLTQRARAEMLAIENKAWERRCKWSYDRAMAAVVRPCMTFEEWIKNIDLELDYDPPKHDSN